MIRKLLGIILIFTLTLVTLSGCKAFVGENEADGETSEGATEDPDAIRIGVALWSSNDVLGSRCKEILWEAAETIGVKLVFSDHGFRDGGVERSCNELIEAGCSGIVVCNFNDEDMSRVIEACDDAGVYVAQSFRMIDEIDGSKAYELAKASRYYVGNVHENEIENGKRLVGILLDRGDRNIGLMGWKAGDIAWEKRCEGYRMAIDTWNTLHHTDQARLSEPVYGGIDMDGAVEATNELLENFAGIDALIVGGGGGEPMVGALSAINAADKTGFIDVVGTDFVDDLDDRIKDGTIIGESGGSFCDPLFAFMMVYGAVNSGESFEGKVCEIRYPYMYATSMQDYREFEEKMVDQIPFTPEEFIELSQMDPEGLAQKAASMEDLW